MHSMKQLLLLLTIILVLLDISRQAVHGDLQPACKNGAALCVLVVVAITAHDGWRRAAGWLCVGS